MTLLSSITNQLRMLFQLIKNIHLKYQVIMNSKSLKVIVGAASTKQNDWISTNYPILNLNEAQTFNALFGKLRVKAFLAEHVWEHLSDVDCIEASRNCFNFLESGGYLRIAVPDGLHSSVDYVNNVKLGGFGYGADDHKVLYNYKTLSKVLLDSGFEVKLLEWFDESGQFNFVDWLPSDGLIERSTRFDERNKTNPTAYTSLIIDAIKP